MTPIRGLIENLLTNAACLKARRTARELFQGFAATSEHSLCANSNSGRFFGGFTIITTTNTHCSPNFFDTTAKEISKRCAHISNKGLTFIFAGD